MALLDLVSHDVTQIIFDYKVAMEAHELQKKLMDEHYYQLELWDMELVKAGDTHYDDKMKFVAEYKSRALTNDYYPFRLVKSISFLLNHKYHADNDELVHFYAQNENKMMSELKMQKKDIGIMIKTIQKCSSAQYEQIRMMDMEVISMPYSYDHIGNAKIENNGELVLNVHISRCEEDVDFVMQDLLLSDEDCFDYGYDYDDEEEYLCDLDTDQD